MMCEGGLADFWIDLQHDPLLVPTPLFQYSSPFHRLPQKLLIMSQSQKGKEDIDDGMRKILRDNAIAAKGMAYCMSFFIFVFGSVICASVD